MLAQDGVMGSSTKMKLGPPDYSKSLFVTWGYNRTYYNNSDVHFKGEGFDFTLFDAKAQDMPEKFDPKVYFNPTRFTVPQFNFRMGYYFKTNWAISLGWDHMKYRLITTQLLRISGDISEEKYFDPQYVGNFDNDYILYSGRFMDYHHSDGFNFIRAALEKRTLLYRSPRQIFVIAFNSAASIGVMVPWTDFTFFGEHNRNRLHVSGYGLSFSTGFRIEFYRYIFLQLSTQTGWSNLTDVMLEGDKDSRARQKINFFERSVAIGAYIPLLRADNFSGPELKTP